MHVPCVHYCSHVAWQLVSCVATGQSHMCHLLLALATVFMAHLGAGMATGLLQPLAILGALDKHVCLIIRVTLPARMQDLALLNTSDLGSCYSTHNSADKLTVCCKRTQEASTYIFTACSEASRI